MIIAILSDIHGNISAFTEVLKRCEEKKAEALINLGDIIDYGMHSNEIIELLNNLDMNILCNIWGNHENSIINNDFERFSSSRGIKCAQYTQSILKQESVEYIKDKMCDQGKIEFSVQEKKCLAVHGSMEDVFWKAIKRESNLEQYLQYDFVFYGHSHLPHFFEEFYKVDDEIHRNKKKTVFVNPGAVGQPRNLCNMAQFVLWNTDDDSFSFEKVKYDIKAEQSAYNGQVDDFYRTRLENGV